MTASCTRELPGTHYLLPLAAANPVRYPALLESVAPGSVRTRYDILFAFPSAEIRLDRIADGARFLDALDAAWRRERIDRSDDDALPFRGGWLVYLGYELANEIEPKLRLPTARSDMPVALALRCLSWSSHLISRFKTHFIPQT